MKAVVLCDGEIIKKQIIQNELADSGLFIAADGGANHAYKLGLVPDVIIGDLDSYTETGQETAEVIHKPGQETNDLEKALSYAAKKNVQQVIVFGATGKRLDHTLKNLSVLLQFNSQFSSIVFKDRYSTIFLVTPPFKKEFPVGTSISLFPLSGTVENITTIGLKYPLKNGILKNGVQDGSSNQTCKKTVEINFKKGDLLLLVNH